MWYVSKNVRTLETFQDFLIELNMKPIRTKQTETVRKTFVNLLEQCAGEGRLSPPPKKNQKTFSPSGFIALIDLIKSKKVKSE